jgi:hypothetical protein
MTNPLRLLGVLAAVLATLPAAAFTTADKPHGLEIVDTAVVFDHGNYDPYDLTNLHGFNHGTSVVATPGGGLMAAWFSGPFEASVHQSITASRSDDGGRTWSDAFVKHDAPRTCDFDPAFIRDGDRLWAFHSTGRWSRWPFVRNGPDEPPAVGALSFQIWARTSDDGGATWTDAAMPLPAPGWNCRSNGIRLSTGELVLPLHYLDPPHKSAALWSDDGGQTWQISSEVVAPPRVTAAEPTIVELNDGSLLMGLRTRDGFLWTSRSADKGRTWSEPVQTEVPAGSASHNLFRLHDGSLLLTYNPGPLPLRTQMLMRRSWDDGKTWSAPLELAAVEAAPADPGDIDQPWSRQVSYPSVAQLDDGTVVAVWGLIELSNGHQSGIIHAARVRVAE